MSDASVGMSSSESSSATSQFYTGLFLPFVRSLLCSTRSLDRCTRRSSTNLGAINGIFSCSVFALYFPMDRSSSIATIVEREVKYILVTVVHLLGFASYSRTVQTGSYSDAGQIRCENKIDRLWWLNSQIMPIKIGLEMGDMRYC